MSTPQKSSSASSPKNEGVVVGVPVPGTPGPSGVQGAGGQSLECIKCLQDTTLSASTSSGKNPLRRVCHPCAASDRARQRASKKNASVGKSFAAMSKDDQVAWYRREKSERLAAESKSKRTFDDLVVSCSETTSVGDELRDTDAYETFEDWAMRQIALGKLPDLSACEAEWSRILQQETHRCTKRRGQWLLARYAGCTASRLETSSTSTNVSQRKRVKTADELGAISEKADELLNKRRNLRLGQQVQVAPSVLCPDIPDDEVEGACILEVAHTSFRRNAEREFLQRQVIAWELEQRMLDEFAQDSQERASRKGSTCPAVAKSLDVVKIETQTLVLTTIGKIDTLLQKTRLATNSLVLQMQRPADDDEGGGVAEAPTATSTTIIKELQAAAQAVEELAATQKAKFQAKHEAAKTSDQLLEVGVEAKALVSLVSGGDCMNKYKAAVKEGRGWVKAYTRSLQKQAAAGAKASANKHKLEQGATGSIDRDPILSLLQESRMRPILRA